MRRATTAVAVVLLLAACATPGTGPGGPDGAGAGTDGTDAVDGTVEVACVPPVAPVAPDGAVVDLAADRAAGAAGTAGGTSDVVVLDLGGGDAPALAAAVAATLDPCEDTGPVDAVGGLGAIVVAGARAAAEGLPLRPAVRPDRVADPAAGAAAAAAATRDLVARWGAEEVLVVGEDDTAAWTALVAEATTAAVPLLLPAPPPPPAAPDPTPADPGGTADADGGDDAAAGGDDAVGDDPPPAPVDPAVAALGTLPADVRVTVVASDADAAAVLADRVVAAGRTGPGVRVVADGPTARPAGWSGTAGGTLWLADPSDPVRLVVAAAAAGARDEAVLAVDPTDVVGFLRRAGTVREVAPARVVLAGATTADATAAWALDVALHVPQLPWGGWLPLDGTRIVALYGAPGAPTLGALGQQDLDATFARVRDTAARYDGLDGLRVVPGFDLIVTVASAAPGPAGDYSQRVPIERLRPLIDRARVEGMAVFIDLQPGRTDFLAQAQEYEELLLEPHVFLALDPEWRLGPDQVHLRQIGSVEAAEVQRVADWLAELVRRERLPRKAFMLHQFLLEMLPDRDAVVVPPELVGVVHVDGQGPVATKERTFRIMAEGADPQWRWGWKQFLRIDTPAVMEPADVVDRAPVPVVVTYQ